MSLRDANQTLFLARYAKIPGGADMVPCRNRKIQLLPVQTSSGCEPVSPLYDATSYARRLYGHSTGSKLQSSDSYIRLVWLVACITDYRVLSRRVCASSTPAITSSTSTASAASQEQFFPPGWPEWPPCPAPHSRFVHEQLTSTFRYEQPSWI
jgi:hypothetical protein